MNFLLKIVDGPMKGAEIALLAGTRVKVGSSDSCDVVIADASFPAVAFELDVAADSVMMITPDGAQRPMKPLEVCDFGTTGVAVGPADEPWGQLTRPSAEPEPAEQAPEPGPEASEPPADEPEPAGEPASEKPSGKKGRGGCIGCALSALVALLLLAAAAFLLWRFWPPARQFVSGFVDGGNGQASGGEAQQAEASVVKEASLSDIASQHGLQFSEEDGVPTIRGNLKRRTERMAIRALAKSANPLCKLDVTDDETMLASSKELVFAYTEGSIKVLAATNRVIALGGYAPSPDALARTIRALNEDIRGIDNIDTSNVAVGGIAPAELAGTAFVQERAASSAPAPAAPAAAGVTRPFAPKGPTNSRLNIAGILTVPYPCVVLQSGHRVMEGAQIGSATLVKIEADRLEMKEGDRTFEWTP